MPPAYPSCSLHRRHPHSSPTIRIYPKIFDSKPLPLLPYMVTSSTPQRSTSDPKNLRTRAKPEVSLRRNAKSEELREVVEDYLWIVGSRWQGYLGDPNPYRNAKEWEREMRKLAPLYQLGWEEDKYREGAEKGWWERRV